VRLFVAVDPSEAVRATLAAAVRSGREIAPNARWVDPASIHLTLFFLGEVEAPEARAIEPALVRAASSHAGFELAFGKAGVFDSRGVPRILWVGVSRGERDLVALQADVSRELGAAGFSADERAYSPHLTLARAGNSRGDRALGDARRTLGDAGFGATHVAEIVLYESHLGRGPARYEARARVPLRHG
jgi:RNA 2',3'-cyclic 3'-phosphodiesterase